ncbi:MAG: 16S rRNA (guanine(527)-N(7))-methyltransferase RsmG [Candidatus Gracilibacteria bacterium]
MDLHALFASYNWTLSVSEEALFRRFLTLFIAYNSHTNLSAIRDEEGIIIKHFIDSLAVLRAVNVEGKILDIGSGGGFPGIPLKIIQPSLQMTLLDSVGKKVKAMNYFVQELGLQHISALQERAEILAKNRDYAGKYDYVVSRATAYMSDILPWSMPFLKRNGKIILYKIYSEEEQKDGEQMARKLGLILETVYQYELAGQTRCLYIFQRNKKII